ncbi:RnaseH-domain-containing protein [Polyporus arcularius HHB13444]|uniref:ribonuclease H n=1 Tax=Polyporus arcularius HHB13444 TaxID=1314778 RepID=A0A5C3PBI7_9APHY|nr:RnaseH-domain-containing protein [Polyporus arcularius HHB13444]
MAGIFRVFVPKDGGAPERPIRRPRRRFQVDEERITAYTDGSCDRNGSGNAVAGSGVWCGGAHTLNCGVKVPVNLPQTNQVAEIYAVSVIAARAPPFAPLDIVSDSKYVINGLTSSLRGWEAKGWIGVANAMVIKDAVARLRSRSAVTTLQWVKGHSGSVGNDAADALAKQGAEAGEAGALQLPDPPKEYLLPGAKLHALTQKLAYQGVRLAAKKHLRPATEATVARVQASLLHETGVHPTEARLWQAIRRPEIARKQRDFLWKALHRAQRVGSYWNHIPGYEQRAKCTHCGEEESMEHILVDCSVAPVSVIWDLVRGALGQKSDWLPTLSLGVVLGAAALTFAAKAKKATPGLDRLFAIMVTESAYLIWKLRCERVIDLGEDRERWHTAAETENRWFAVMNRRLTLDRALTSARFGKKAKDRGIVLRTWSGILHAELSLPDDWINTPAVLVGKHILGPRVRGEG